MTSEEKWICFHKCCWDIGYMTLRPKHLRIGSTGDSTYTDHHVWWLGLRVRWETKGAK